MKNKKFIKILVLLVFCGFFIYSACETDKGNDPTLPTGPGIIGSDVSTLNISYLLTGGNISISEPLILHIYDNKSSITNQSNPLLTQSTTNTNDTLNIPNIPSGTYYILIWRDEGTPATLQTCERYLIWTNFSCLSGQSVNATPVDVPIGTTINVDIDVDFSSFDQWGSCGVEE